MNFVDSLGQWWDKYSTWEFWQAQLQIILEKSLIILFIILLTWIVLKVRKIIIKRIFKLTRLDPKQEKTLESLLLSLTKYAIFIIASLMILANMEINIGPIIAGAGVLGLAIGFGAQTLVKDLITGFFIIFEDQFSVGDYVTINGGQINGTVVSVGLRATKIRTWAQHVVVIPNSEIHLSQNYNRERMRVIIYFTVPYEIAPETVEEAIYNMSSEISIKHKDFFLLDDQGEIIEPLKLYGITDVENNALGAKYCIICLVKDTSYWAACNVVRKSLIEHFREQKIQISYPRRVERVEPEYKQLLP